jgi:ubiquinone/menaquinone biosynthesis C-methylase UbiE
VIRRKSLAWLVLALPLLWPVAGASQPSKQDINAPFVTDPDVLRWKSELENDQREVYAKRMEITAAVGLKPGMTVADVGAGSGLFTRLFAKAVSPGGRVYAVDISKPLLDYVMQTAKQRRLGNVTAILDTADDTKLPESSVDLVYVCDTYHHFEHPQEVLASIRKALRPGGRLVIVDFERIEGKSPKWLLEHVRAGKGTVKSEIEAAGFRFGGEKKFLRENYFIEFRRM